MLARRLVYALTGRLVDVLVRRFVDVSAGR